MGTSSAAQVTCLPEASESGGSCSTRQVCFPQGNDLETQERSVRWPLTPWQDLVTQGPEKKERQKAIKRSLVIPLIAKLLLLIFIRKTGKVEGRNHRQVGMWFPSQPWGATIIPLVALLIYQLLSVCFSRVRVTGRRQESCRVESHSVLLSLPPHSFSLCPGFLTSWPIDFVLEVSSYLTVALEKGMFPGCVCSFGGARKDQTRTSYTLGKYSTNRTTSVSQASPVQTFS